jgi:hypothetical protein
MPLGPGFPSSTNVFVPALEASGRLTIGYSRNVDRFHLPRYCRYTQTQQTVGLYMKLSAQEAARVVTQQDYEWPDGQPRPMHANGLESFNMLEFRCHRYDYGFTVGWLTKQQAEWPIVEQHSQIHAAKCMTARTERVLKVATNVANWQTTADPDMSANHTATATALAGGQFDLSTSTNLYIKKALDKVAALINLDTLGTVESSQLHVIINPNQARLWAEAPEIHEYIKGSYHAKEEITEGLQPNNKYGLPSSIYGYPIVVENCVKVSSRKGAANTKVFAMPDQQVLIVARPGGLEGVYGAPDFSTLTMFYHGSEMELETFDMPIDRLTSGHVTENCAEILTSPISGYLITASTSVAS